MTDDEVNALVRDFAEVEDWPGPDVVLDTPADRAKWVLYLRRLSRAELSELDASAILDSISVFDLVGPGLRRVLDLAIVTQRRRWN